jgi:general secretion pathway protein K
VIRKTSAALLPYKDGDESGFALIVVLWFLVLLAGIGAVLLANGRNETAAARNLELAASAEALADAGIAQTVFNLEDTIPTNRWALDGKPHRLLLPGGEVVIRIEDENAKINPNSASDALLAALFETLGIERNRAARIGAAIADWVSKDMKPRPQGAKLEQYQAAGLTYGPPNAPMETLDELQLVLGMTPEIFAMASPYLSIFSEPDGSVTQNASPVVLDALQLAVSRRKTREAAEEAAADQPEAGAVSLAPGDDQEMPDEQEEMDEPDQPDAMADAMAGPPETVILRAEVTARTNDGGVFVRSAVLRLDAAKPKGYTALDWRRGQLSVN